FRLSKTPKTALTRPTDRLKTAPGPDSMLSCQPRQRHSGSVQEGLPILPPAKSGIEMNNDLNDC
ncbi:MAG: hypothetical protein WBM84_18455, partial [Sedimenticolaceae bacterium]